MIYQLQVTTFPYFEIVRYDTTSSVSNTIWIIGSLVVSGLCAFLVIKFMRGSKNE